MTTEFYKDKVQQLQQKVDEQYEMIKHLKNELLLCKEVDKNMIISKGRTTATIPPEFSVPSNVHGLQLERILKDREKAIERLDKKNASDE